MSEFLGVLQYLNQFMGTHWASVSKPLRALLKSTAEWSWGEAQRAAFEELKRLGALAVELAVPDYARAVDGTVPFEVFADMSNFAAGAGLFQKDSSGEHYVPTASKSRSLTASQMLWPAWTKELNS